MTEAAGAAAPVENSLGGFFTHLLDTSSYPARWNCGSWTSLEGWLHILSDVGIFLAYFVIPGALLYFVCKRKDVPFYGIFFLFAAFILFCGTTHLLEAVIFYHPIYRVAGLLKLGTAVVSWITVVALWRLIPQLLDLPGLITRNEMLRKADEAKSLFLANMSHEIRTPMTAILGYAELLTLRGNQNQEQQTEALQAIKRNGAHLLQVINDILDLSKIEAGKLELDVQECSPLSIVADVSSLLRVRAIEQGLTLSVCVDGSIPEKIATDPTRLRQVLINLVGNAVKFTDSGMVQITLRYIAAKEGSPAQMQFEVLDTGPGIEPQEIDRLFSPFTQLDNSTTRRFGGTGLGLSISQQLATVLGGGIRVTSELGTGSIFTVTIDAGNLQNVRMLDRAAESHAGQRIEDRSESDPGRLDCRILLVEDGPDNQRLIRLLLEKAGAEVTLAENGQIALERVHKAEVTGRAFDLILMDMQMPVLDGYEATRSLRAEGYQLPIVALTAHAMAGDRQKCLEAGCTEYVSKPVNRRHLIATIRNCLVKDACGTAGE